MSLIFFLLLGSHSNRLYEGILFFIVILNANYILRKITNEKSSYNENANCWVKHNAVRNAGMELHPGQASSRYQYWSDEYLTLYVQF